MAEGFGSIDAVDAATLFAATGSFRTIQLTSTLLPGLNKSMLAALPFADEPTAMLERPSHSLFGNTVRSRPGPVPIELDDALRSLPGLWSKA
jgi:hypothetical protein